MLLLKILILINVLSGLGERVSPEANVNLDFIFISGFAENILVERRMSNYWLIVIENFEIMNEDDYGNIDDNNVNNIKGTIYTMGLILVAIFLLLLILLIFSFRNSKKIKLLKHKLDYYIKQIDIHPQQFVSSMKLENKNNPDTNGINSEISELNKILKALEERISGLEHKITIMQDDNHIKLNEHINNFKDNSNELPSGNYEMYYLNYPNLDGSFNINKSRNSDFTRPFTICIRSGNTQEGELDIIDNQKAHLNLINNYHIYLTPIADIMHHDKNGTKIVVLRKGVLKLAGDKWIPINKVQLKII